MKGAGGSLETILARFSGWRNREAVHDRGKTSSYVELSARIAAWRRELQAREVGAGHVIAVVADFSLESIALIFAAIADRAILVPFTRAVEVERQSLAAIAGVSTTVILDDDDKPTWTHSPAEAPPILATFRARGNAGLVVFTSGSTGTPKGILHDCERVLDKFLTPRDSWRTVLFLMMDHFGGFNTLMGCVASGGLCVCVPDRRPSAVCEAIERSGATLLPTTPTFLNLLAASGAYHDYDLSSIQLVTYGTEVMAERTLARVREAFPRARLKQTYGLSEVGVLRSQSESDESVWVRLGGGGSDVRIVDDILWIRSHANMVGYINAASPFDDDGWLCTGDRVEQQGDYVRILGRSSDMINVGGQKVFPAEVEDVLLEDPNVIEAAVSGAPHPLLGKVVHARVTVKIPETHPELITRLRRLCVTRLARFKIPVRFEVVDGASQVSGRFKKIRGSGPDI